ncbi:UNVERIFIED_CONTAM: hypothetical protein NCL1_08221 [Trichonephila clavipes]
MFICNGTYLFHSPLSRYLQCTYNAINENCGEFAANFTHLYISKAAGEEVEEVCQKMHNYPDIDSKICSNPIPNPERRNNIFSDDQLVASP